MFYFTKNYIFVVLLSLITLPAWAYHSFHDTGDLLENKQLRLTLAPQFIIGSQSGTNLTGFVDTPWEAHSNIRYFFGVGSSNIHLGSLYKWVAYPDFDSQPAIGVSTGFLFAQLNGESEFSILANPFISKKFIKPFGDFNTYASLPVSLQFYRDKTDFPIQIAVGTQLKTHHVKSVEFMVELGVDVHHAFSYISFGAIYMIDNKDRFL